MKTLLTLFIVSFMATGLQAQSIGQNTIDEFTGAHTVSSEPVTIDHSGFSGLSSVLAFYSDQLYTFTLRVQSDDSWQLLSRDTAYFLIDGERKQHKLRRAVSDVKGGYTLEAYFILLSKAEFRSFGKAKEVRFRIGTNTYEMNREALDSFTLVYDTVN